MGNTLPYPSSLYCPSLVGANRQQEEFSFWDFVHLLVIFLDGKEGRAEIKMMGNVHPHMGMTEQVSLGGGSVMNLAFVLLSINH